MVSRKVPPRCAVTTIIPALGGPSSTTCHSWGVKSAFAVIATSSWIPSGRLAQPLDERSRLRRIRTAHERDGNDSELVHHDDRCRSFRIDDFHARERLV